MEHSDRAWQSHTVLCTGATGIVGSWVVHALLEVGASVVALVRDVDERVEFFRSGAARRVRLVHGDLQDYRLIERTINQYEIDTVIHLGAQAIVSAAERAPLETFESNIRGTYNVLEACRVHAGLVRAIAVASSDKAYGDTKGEPYTEDQPLLARHPYDVSKSCTDMLAQTYAYTYDMPIAIARCGNIFGGGDLNWSRIVPGTIRALRDGQSPQIRSDGSYVRDYLYVKDAAAAYLLLAEHAGANGVRGEAFNFSARQPLSVLELVRRIAELMGKRHLEPRILDQARHEIPRQVLVSNKARERLGWRPRYGMDEALRETIEWYTRFLAEGEGARDDRRAVHEGTDAAGHGNGRVSGDAAVRGDGTEGPNAAGHGNRTDGGDAAGHGNRTEGGDAARHGNGTDGGDAAGHGNGTEGADAAGHGNGTEGADAAGHGNRTEDADATWHGNRTEGADFAAGGIRPAAEGGRDDVAPHGTGDDARDGARRVARGAAA